MTRGVSRGWTGLALNAGRASGHVLARPRNEHTMKALVFHSPGKVSVDNVPDPQLQKPDDIIVRVTSTAICGSDLHIYNGFVPQLRDEVLGHEFMGIVEETGSAVTKVK